MRVNGVEEALPSLALQYKDYAVWQQAQMKEQRMQEHKAFWLQHLEGELPVLELPGDRPRPAIKRYKGAVVHATLRPELVHALKKFCREQGGTLFMGLLAAVNAILYRYTGQTDIIV